MATIKKSIIWLQLEFPVTCNQELSELKFPVTCNQELVFPVTCKLVLSVIPVICNQELCEGFVADVKDEL